MGVSDRTQDVSLGSKALPLGHLATQILFVQCALSVKANQRVWLSVFMPINTLLEKLKVSLVYNVRLSVKTQS